ncbi:uncharacterized protein LOC131859222 [Cryptomeria japonica]|uniref:uncharacterized protein LOC131859222 n=1 Tax=Cryptomeria japonica TaxID=3369 RepID=UPI0027DA788E|nr:uncharacterized protein LOC131859222 [Cryptomeria japonica]
MSSSKDGKKKDLSKIKYFCFYHMGHYASQYPNKKNKGKSKNQVATTIERDKFATRFENEFLLIVFLSSSIAKSVWYIDSAASCHMTGVREYFTKFEEKKLDFCIELGDNAKYHGTGFGMVKFQRDFGKPLLVEDMLYVPSMTNNLIYVSTLEDRSYIVTFEGGKVYICHKNYKVAKKIGVRHDYYVTFIDDLSKKTWIYFMKNKDEVFSRFKEFKALMENQIERKIKILRFDNGGEYTLNDFKDFYAREGIKKDISKKD